jgi:threonine dehydratase
MSTTLTLVGPGKIDDAARRLTGIAIRTPLLPAPWIGELSANANASANANGNGAEGEEEAPQSEIRIKCESLQHGGSFKLRGAYNMIAGLPESARRRGIITYSSGNHGQAVALAARAYGIPATIVVPETAPAIKVEAIERLGAELLYAGTTSLDRQTRAEELAAERRATIIPPFNHLEIIAGQGSGGKEILEDWAEVDAVLVPIGGGGLISGIAAWIKRVKPDCRVIGVEPANTDSMNQSIRAGEPTTIKPRKTLADGLASIRPGDITFAHVRELVDEIVTVDEEAIDAAANAFLTRARLVVEHSGATAAAAVLSGRWQPRGRRTAIVISGGNRLVTG